MALSIEEQILELRAMIEIVAENAGLKNRLSVLVPKKVEELRAKMPKTVVVQPAAEIIEEAVILSSSIPAPPAAKSGGLFSRKS